MKITKLEHSGIIVEENGAKLVFDPVEIETKLPELDNVKVIVITHGHSDHFQPEVINRILAKNPDAKIFAPEDVEVENAEHVLGGETRNVDEFNLEFFGENHAEILTGKYVCRNLGVVVNDKIVNPGDSLLVEERFRNKPLLLVASVAPWLKLAESAEYIVTMSPEIAVPFHNALNSRFGNQVDNNWLRRICNENGIQFEALSVGESLEI